VDPLLRTASLLSQSRKRKPVQAPPSRLPIRKPPAPLRSEQMGTTVSNEAPVLTRPKNWKVLVRGRWPRFYEMEWEERAAIMTYDGGLPVKLAEERAYESLVKRYEVLKQHEDELVSHEREPVVALLHELFDVKIYAMEWTK
jgi:hypothetical protein